ncbi:flippase-like domain-containing protein [Prevotella sp. A2931]|uniref:Flippase-like domain-containing protein n=1 Tax=Prevotella illustrans TaxID=2800387 RepID=A0ABS3M4B6_9BACT|nr:MULTISPECIES: lysylphosphatidylglycerol synthase transmembrane domain-containing protein [Prevotella]MBO1362961.1 flippase-like domain-containing protein [Prevotella illustrans]PTL27136.1 TIGR00374 family protein [Prevotella sp. oral taxon 820]
MEGSNQRNIVNNIFKVSLSLLLGGLILYWMYRDFDFHKISDVLLHKMNWTWMLLSFPFGVLAQLFRGWRWGQTLEPVGEHARSSVRVNSIFLSYAMSLVIPRIGEFARCGVLRRYDGVSFPKALGTVVTERAIDSLLVLVITGLTILFQLRVFHTFFDKTGTSIDSIFMQFSPVGYLVTAVCGVAALLSLFYLLRRLRIYNKVKATFTGIWQGVLSLRSVRNVPLFIVFTLGIWVSYFLHYYLTFFCFDAMSHLGMMCALVTFIVGSIAVVVPTPNGAGPWHFAVKTMLILYGVADSDALYFVLIVHTVQTMLVILLGVYAWIALSFTKRKHLLNT